MILKAGFAKIKSAELGGAFQKFPLFWGLTHLPLPGGRELHRRTLMAKYWD
jgi:hypothetical protein